MRLTGVGISNEDIPKLFGLAKKNGKNFLTDNYRYSRLTREMCFPDFYSTLRSRLALSAINIKNSKE